MILSTTSVLLNFINKHSSYVVTSTNHLFQMIACYRTAHVEIIKIIIISAEWHAKSCIIDPTMLFFSRRVQPGKTNKPCDQQTQIPDAVSASNSDSRNFRLKTLRLQLNMNPSTLNLRYIR